MSEPFWLRGDFLRESQANGVRAHPSYVTLTLNPSPSGLPLIHISLSSHILADPLLPAGERGRGMRVSRGLCDLLTLEKFGDFVTEVQTAAQEWMQRQGAAINPARPADWREAWHPSKVQVWGRLTNQTDGMEDCQAVHWLHGPYRQAIPTAGIRKGEIKKTSLTGEMGHIGRLWHRMYPYVRLVKDPKNPQKPMPLVTRQYFELLTLFPDDASTTWEFINFLENQQRAFQKLWPT